MSASRQKVAVFDSHAPPAGERDGGSRLDARHGHALDHPLTDEVAQRVVPDEPVVPHSDRARDPSHRRDTRSMSPAGQRVPRASDEARAAHACKPSAPSNDVSPRSSTATSSPTPSAPPGNNFSPRLDIGAGNVTPESSANITDISTHIEHRTIEGRTRPIGGHLPDVACRLRHRSDLFVRCLSRRSPTGRLRSTVIMQCPVDT